MLNNVLSESLLSISRRISSNVVPIYLSMTIKYVLHYETVFKSTLYYLIDVALDILTGYGLDSALISLSFDHWKPQGQCHFCQNEHDFKLLQFFLV